MRAPEGAALQRNGREPVSPRSGPHPDGAFFATLGWDSTAAEFEGFERGHGANYLLAFTRSAI